MIDDRTNFRRLRAISIVAPAAFVSVLFAVTATLADHVPVLLLVSGGVLMVIAVATAFSGFVFTVLGRGDAQLRMRNRQLAAVQAAATALVSERELRALLQRFVELSCGITNARYGALAIRHDDGSIDEFITYGMSDEEHARIGALPVGKGLLAVNIHEGASVRIPEISADPRSGGFPAHHPPMHSLLGVPVLSKGDIIGNLYLTDKIGADEFTRIDEEMVKLFASHAAAAVENTRLETQLRGLAVLEERDRIAMDLHDGIIQSIYSVGLKLEGAAEDTGTAPAEARRSIDAAIEDLTGVIRDVRSYILGLRPADLGDDIATAVRSLAEEFRANSLIDTAVDTRQPLPHLAEEQRSVVFHVAQEALANARRHSQATRVAVTLEEQPDGLVLTVSDNGRGFEPDDELPAQHRGVRNMASRAAAAGGRLNVESAPGRGTVVRLTLPITQMR